MRAEDYLAGIKRLPIAPPDALTEGRPFVVLSPHPDDESLGAGGLIAAACRAGVRVDVVILTDGSGSHPQSRRYPPERLTAVRRSEAEAAAEELGLPVDRLHHLGLPDTKAPAEGPSFERAVESIIAIIRQSDAGTVLVTWDRDPHCDHEAAAQMARALRRREPSLKLWFYPIWGWHLPAETVIDAPAPHGCRVDVTPWLSAKEAAIAAHRSQMTDMIDDDPDGFRFTEEQLAPFLGAYEYFLPVPP